MEQGIYYRGLPLFCSFDGTEKGKQRSLNYLWFEYVL